MLKKTLSALALGAITWSAMPADACIDFEILNRKQGGRLIADAEKALEKGDYEEVIDLLGYGFVEFSDWRHGNKRMELVAVANVRRGWVRTGLMSLRYLARKNPNDPYLLTRLAEGLSHLKSGQKEAAGILAGLERDDLIADAEGYAALARVRARSDDLPGAAKASARCRRMGAPASLCTPRLANS